MSKKVFRKEYPATYALVNYLTLGYEVEKINYKYPDNVFSATEITLVKRDKKILGAYNDVKTLALFTNNEIANSQAIKHSALALIENIKNDSNEFSAPLVEKISELAEYYADAILMDDYNKEKKDTREKSYYVSQMFKNSKKSYLDYFENYYITGFASESKKFIGNLIRGSNSFYAAVERFEYLDKNSKAVELLHEAFGDINNIIYDNSKRVTDKYL